MLDLIRHLVSLFFYRGTLNFEPHSPILRPLFDFDQRQVVS